MYLYLWNFTKRFNSTKIPNYNEKRTIEINLKAPTDIIRPSFILKKSDLQDANYLSFVYGYQVFDSIERLYRITNTVILTNELVEIHCDLDVLATYRLYAGSEQYILRASNSNAYSIGSAIPDSLYPVKPYIVTGQTVSPVIDEGVTYPVLTLTDGFYVLGFTAEKPGATWQANSLVDYRGSIAYMLMTQDQANAFMNKLMNLSAAAADINPLNYVSSLLYFPYNIDLSGKPVMEFMGGIAGAEFKFDYTSAASITAISRGIYTTSDTDFDIPNHPDVNTRGTRMNLEPFTQILFHGGPYGDIQIPNDIFYNPTSPELIIKQKIDLCSGVGLLTFINRYNGNEFMRCNGQVGLTLKISQVYTRSKAQDLALLAGLGASLAKTLGEMATGNMSGALATSLGALGDTLLGVYTGNLPKLSSAGNNDSLIDYVDAWTIQMIYRKAVPENLEEFGRPVYDRLTINQYSGYIKCLAAEISDFPGTTEEYDILIRFMNGGFYYE